MEALPADLRTHFVSPVTAHVKRWQRFALRAEIAAPQFATITVTVVIRTPTTRRTHGLRDLRNE